MSLITAKYIREVAETPLQFHSESGWKAVSTGLRSVALGYFFLICGSMIGGLLLHRGMVEGPMTPLLTDSPEKERDAFLLLGLVTLGVTALVSYTLVLVGQWRCLTYAPQRLNNKELMYVCFNLVLLGSLLNVVGVYLDGAYTYAALREGLRGIATLDVKRPGTLLQLISVGLGLVSSLVFSQFLRSVASCFQDRVRVRSVDLNLGFVGLLLGGSAGTLFFVSRFAFSTALLPWLLGGWLLCFIWHLHLVSSVYRCVEEGLQRSEEGQAKWTRKDRPSTPAIPRPSGLHRTAKQVER